MSVQEICKMSATMEADTKDFNTGPSCLHLLIPHTTHSPQRYKLPTIPMKVQDIKHDNE